MDALKGITALKAQMNTVKLKKDIRAELNEDLLKHFVGTVSLPFEAGANHTVAVKIVDDRGIESLKVIRLESGEMK